jgi:signal transduction histidine kinase/ActR/RegA family two-component response regulator
MSPASPRTAARPDESLPFSGRVAGRLALQLWLASMFCWWVVGIQFSRLWWLVNDKQLDWILFCYAWEVPAVGWTGAVLIPWLRLRRIIRQLPAGGEETGRRLARFPLFTFWMVVGTSTVGYAIGALQVDYFASLPPLEVAKIMIQGPALGGLFAVAAYLMAERAIQDIALPARHQAHQQADRVVESIYGKIFSIAVALTMGVSVPIVLHALSQTQRHREQLRAHALADAIRESSSDAGLEASLRPLGPHTYGFVVRRSNNFIVAGHGAGTVLYGDGRGDFGAIQQQEQGWFASRDGQHKVVAFQHRPGILPDGDGAVFVAVSPITDYSADLAAEGRTSAAVALVSLVIGLVLAAGLARSIVLPIDRLRAAASQMARGELDVAPVGFSRGDEVAALAHAFDRMAVRVRSDEADLRHAYEQLQRAQSQALHHERLSAIGRVASGVAHELNNPLSAVLHLAEDLRADGQRPAHEREALDTIADQARRCRTIVRDLLSFARHQGRRPEPAQAHMVLASARAAAEALLRERQTQLESRVAPDMPDMLTDSSGIEQVLANLIINAIHAAGDKGQVWVEGTRFGEGWQFTVEDSGPGIPADVLPRIFEPFFTTKPEGQGTGLGLAVSLGIVQRLGGTLEAEEGGHGSGARFVVQVPPATTSRIEPSPAEPPKTGVEPEAEGRPRVLVVDDERSIRLALKRYMRRNGWEVDEAEDGEAAVGLLHASPPAGYDLVITDLRMPTMSGFEVHDWLEEHRPDLFERLVIATGDVASQPVREFLNRTSRPVLEKPFELSTLGELLDRARTRKSVKRKE